MNSCNLAKKRIHIYTSIYCRVGILHVFFPELGNVSWKAQSSINVVTSSDATSGVTPPYLDNTFFCCFDKWRRSFLRFYSIYFCFWLFVFSLLEWHKMEGDRNYELLLLHIPSYSTEGIWYYYYMSQARVMMGYDTITTTTYPKLE